MRIDKLWIGKFKNLRDFFIDFDEEQLTAVLIGHNGTGKSNLIEAIVLIFRNLDLKIKPEFDYDITYICRRNKISIKANSKNGRYTITVNGKKISLSKFSTQDNKEYMPKYVFAYYSGSSNRLEEYFDKHQNKFYNQLLYGNETPLRPFFYARLIHSQFVLLSFFSFEDQQSKLFLEKYLGIKGLESIQFILKEPDWKSKSGDSRFWNARGVVQKFLSDLWDHSLSPVYEEVTIKSSYRKKKKEKQLHLYIPDEKSLKKLAANYKSNREFFKMLESTYISHLIREVKIKVKLKNLEDSITFSELAEGEQQLLTVLGLLKFTNDEESLFLLDEPDTHLNPAWKLEYLKLIEDVVGKNEKSHLIICTHDPLVIGGLLKNQVQIFERNDSGKIIVNPPNIDPRGMGVAGLLTSELFGLNTTLDLETQKKLNRKNVLYSASRKRKLKSNEKKELRILSDELSSLGFSRTIRDPLYEKFLSAVLEREEFQRPILTPDERRKQEELAKKIVDEIIEEESK